MTPATFRSFLPLLVVSLVVAFVSLPGLNGPLVLDSTKLHGLEPLAEEYGTFAVFHTPPFGPGSQRIVSMASFVLNIQANGELSVAQVKTTNIVIHISIGLLIFVLTRLILRNSPFSENATLVAIGTSSLWLLAPVNFNVAFYAVQRMAQLSALFSLAGLTFYIAGRLQRHTVRQWVYIALSVLVCLPLAFFSKQNGVLLLGFMFLAEIYLLPPIRPWLTDRYLMIAAAVGAAIAISLLFQLHPGALNYQHRDFTLAERILSQPRALVSYLQHVLIPYGGDAGIYTDDFDASASLLDPPSTLFSIFLCAGLIAFCVIFRRGRWKLAAFSLGFFFVGHVMESTVLPLELYFLHRNYLPSFGIYLGLVYVLVSILPDRKWILIILTAYSTYFAVISHARSLTWSSRENIVYAAVHHHPRSARALSAYAQIAVEHGAFDRAVQAVDRTIELSGTLNNYVQRLYVLCRAGTDIPTSEYAGLRTVDKFGVSNEISQALNNLLTLYQNGSCKRLAPVELVEALDEVTAKYQRNGGNSWTIQYYSDSFLYFAGMHDSALQRLQDRLEAGHLKSGLYWLELLIRDHRPDEARSALNQLTNKFEAPTLGPYDTMLREFERRIDELERE